MFGILFLGGRIDVQNGYDRKTYLKPNQFAVGHALYSTGQILEKDKTSFHLGKGEVYLIFDSKPEALNYMKRTVTDMPNIECWMEDSSGNHIVTIDPNGERR